MKKITAIIQARMGSTRLPKKVLSDIVGKPMLWHVIDRVKKSKLIDEIILATTTNKDDIEIVSFAKDNNILFFQGSEENVLDRYYQTAIKHDAKDIVRITADDPLKDPEIIDKVIKTYLENDADYVSNTIEPTFPLGLDVEVFSFSALDKAWKKAVEKFEKEHVTPYIYTNPDKFKLINVKNEGENLYHHRWTVDTKEDLEFTRKIFNKLYEEGKIFLMKDILELVKSNPNIRKINENIKSKNIFSEV